uniref:Uncharacterized protein n=1 Tax=Vitis vinifera TaxID=29760 RepID=F6H109_VITVI
METTNFHDSNLYNFVDGRSIDFRHDVSRSLQMHSSLLRRLTQEGELEGHQGCVNTVAWNSRGSLLISGSDDTRVGEVEVGEDAEGFSLGWWGFCVEATSNKVENGLFREKSREDWV